MDRKKVRAALFVLILFAGMHTMANAQQDAHIKPAIYHKNKPVTLTQQDYEKMQKYKICTKDEALMTALYSMEGSMADFSRRAILGENLTGKPIKVQFKNLGEIDPKYQNYDALGWKIGSRLYIFINDKHKTAPPQALASLLSHEAMHQDAFNSTNEETYAWTMEAATWTNYIKKNPTLQTQTEYPLVRRLNTLNDLFVKANYTDKYIRKVVKTNDGYRDLPVRSPGFEQ
ncbi:MAG: hypothetical protein PHE78_00755 [Candidatus Gastranaerophilales bacterium]|jgi:hypothetical protein|nr:hypothetical protein [Candidatus Gastranaerophilales bacterium]